MGRTSKFSFPIPGRKHTTGKEGPPVKPFGGPGNNLSKAQRILGTESDLNIDSPIRDDDHSWTYAGSRSSGMSISISESTQSTNESGSIHEYLTDQWVPESAVLPDSSQLQGKASSTLLGNRFGDEELTPTSSVSGRVRNESSSSTLRSYYDRQKSPLSISQQTSASSARDLALRKGCPPVIPRSPLLRVESYLDPFDAQFSAKDGYEEQNAIGDSPEKLSRKKPARLDLSKLFPRAKRAGSSTPSPSSVSNNASRDATLIPESERRKLKKSHSKESIQSQKDSIRSTRSHDLQQGQTHGNFLQVRDRYEHIPTRSPRMDRIPKSSVPQRENHQSRLDKPSKPKMNRESYSHSPEQQPFSGKSVQSSMTLAPLESSSAASISSRNTKTSRHTNNSALSKSDLQEKSVLSLSSDSEGDDSDGGPAQSRSALQQIKHTKPKKSKGSSRPSKEKRRRSLQQPGSLTASMQGNDFEDSTGSSESRMSSPCAQPELSQEDPQIPRRSSHEEKRVSRASSSLRTERQLQPTPPLSPTSVEFRQSSEGSSRFMAVTKQEEALLEALRQKRARMREEILEEHKTASRVPPIPERNASRNAIGSASRNSVASSINTVRGASGGKERVLLYLDTPISETRIIDTAEPSPDLSDFSLDEGSTPRTSWAPPKKGQPRPDSLASPQAKFDQLSPMTPPSGARLSAVGNTQGFTDGRLGTEAMTSKKRNPGVRFVDDSRLVNAQDFLDEEESEHKWRL